MNSKAIRKQLLAAVAMVLVAAVALGSSTYAWFANNNTVTAKGLQVNATTDQSLMIKGQDAGEVFGSIGTTTLQRLTLHPATSMNGVDFAKLGDKVQVKKSGESTATWSGENGAFTQGSDFTKGDLVTATNAGEDYYYLEAQYTLKAVGTSQNVYLKDFTLTGSSALKPALRMSITCNSVTKVFNIGGGTNPTEGVGKKGTSAWELASVTYTKQGTLAASFGTLTANTEYPVIVRIWFEGQDTACYTDHVDLNNTDVTMNFTTETTGWSAA